MLKKTTLLLLFCSLWSCGFTPLYLKKNDLDRPIKTVKFNGDQNINRIIMASLGLKEDKNIETGYSLTLNSTKKIEVISKDKNGSPSVYRSSIIVNFLLIYEGDIFKQKNFDTSFTYNNSNNKFDLSQYQKKIEENLVNEISEKIFIYLRT